MYHCCGPMRSADCVGLQRQSEFLLTIAEVILLPNTSVSDHSIIEPRFPGLTCSVYSHERHPHQHRPQDIVLASALHALPAVCDFGTRFGSDHLPVVVVRRLTPRLLGRP